MLPKVIAFVNKLAATKSKAQEEVDNLQRDLREQILEKLLLGRR